MSATPLTRVGLPTLGRLADVDAGTLRRRVGPIIRTALADVRSVPHYLVRYSVLVLALLGLLNLWEAHGDGPIPGLSPLTSSDKDPHRCSNPRYILVGTSDADRWRGLAPALAILDEVNPQAACWVRDRYARGALVFSDQDARARDNQASLARYDHFRRRLIVQRGLFAQTDGEAAAVLCHEYRHSRQNTAKVVKCALSFVVAAAGDQSILENDALLYEQEARAAIFGQ